MRNTRYGFLVLLSSLLMLTGCSRRDILDDYPVSGVDIKLDWDGVTDQLPEGVRVIFYPKNGDGRKVDKYLSVRGGEMKVPPGRYSVVVYNYNTESIRIRGEESYETIEAYTGNCNGLGIEGTEGDCNPIGRVTLSTNLDPWELPETEPPTKEHAWAGL